MANNPGLHSSFLMTPLKREPWSACFLSPTLSSPAASLHPAPRSPSSRTELCGYGRGLRLRITSLLSKLIPRRVERACFKCSSSLRGEGSSRVPLFINKLANCFPKTGSEILSYGWMLRTTQGREVSGCTTSNIEFHFLMIAANSPGSQRLKDKLV